MLEDLLAGEVLEVRVVDPALAYLFIGQGEDVLEQQNAITKRGVRSVCRSKTPSV